MRSIVAILMNMHFTSVPFPVGSRQEVNADA